MSDNMEPTTNAEVQQVIENTLALAGLKGVDAPMPASTEEEPDPEMDAYLAKFDTLANMTAQCKLLGDEIASIPYLSSGDKKLLELATLQNELLHAITTQLVAMNNIFGRE